MAILMSSSINNKTGFICGALSVVTTIGIHSFFKSPGSFEEALVIYKEPMYILSKWWVIIHCLLVIISMYCISKTNALRNKPFISLALVFYIGFGFFEILRMTLVLNYLTTLRDQYLMTTDESVKNILKLSIESFNGTGNALFTAFSICFLLANFFLGLSFPWKDLFSKILKTALLLWSGMTIMFIAADYIESAALSSFFNYFNLIFQPGIRLALAVYLLYDLKKSISGQDVDYAIASSVR
jgi:hypothetical protein